MNQTQEIQIHKTNINKQKGRNYQLNSNTIILEDFNIPFTLMDKSFRQKINKEILALKDTFDTLR